MMQMTSRFPGTAGNLMLLALCIVWVPDTVLAAGPSFDCAKVETGSIEEMICKDDQLSALDRKMTVVYGAATKKATNEHPPVLKAGQRGWIKGRNECWKSDERRLISSITGAIFIASGRVPITDITWGRIIRSATSSLPSALRSPAARSSI
jgi:uncharacterized protein